ncbi:MAG: NAD(P)-dependent glycerol-3-phosphate dehydrogenase [Betaproteobacteria bacterium]|nr:NAD(P)-dependent glycerol-3-phosphate dehydrogenase [Betaproteobacteria bacterium]
MNTGILGGGAWGSALASSLSGGHDVELWGRDAGLLEKMRHGRRNDKYLPGIALHDAIRFTSEFESACANKDLIVIATPVGGLRETLSNLRDAGCKTPVLWLCKGFERGTAKLPHQVAQEELPCGVKCGTLSGPSFAKDVARGLPAALTLASADAKFGRDMGLALNSSRLRIYSSDDLTGVEVGGAVKNVIAIAAGISDGLGLGESARAALITRGLAELTRLGLGLGGKLDTFLGLAGAGDLMLTCTSDQSRNRKVGLALAKGDSLGDILARLGHVAEGVYTAQEALRLGERLGVETPITSAVCGVLQGKLTPRAAVDELMRREPKRDSPV